MTPEELIEASRDLIKDLQDEPSKYARQAPECISQLLARIAELEAEARRLSEPNACDDWGNPVVLGVSGGSNGKL